MNATTDLKIDAIDIQILRQLQNSSQPLTNAALAKAIALPKPGETKHLSEATCYRRVKELKDKGVIRHYSVELDADKLDLGFMAFVHVKLLALAKLEGFQEGVSAMPAVLECFAVTGRMDYQLKVMTRDRKSFYDVLNQLRQLPGVSRFETSIVLDEIKSTTALPLDHLRPVLHAHHAHNGTAEGAETSHDLPD